MKGNIEMIDINFSTVEQFGTNYICQSSRQLTENVEIFYWFKNVSVAQHELCLEIIFFCN